MKKLVICLSILIILIIGVSILKDVIIKGAIESIVYISTGLKMEIKELKVSISKTFIHIKDIVVLNPDNFQDKMMLYIPEIYIDYDLSSIFKKKIRLNDVRIDIKEFTVIKAQDGKTNIDSIKDLKKKSDSSQKQKKSTSKSLNLQIDKLSLKIGKIIYKDYSKGEEPVISEYKINLDSSYKNLTNPRQIMRIIAAKAIINTAIGSFTDFSKFKEVPGDILGTGKDILEKTVDEIKGVLMFPFKEND